MTGAKPVFVDVDHEKAHVHSVRFLVCIDGSSYSYRAMRMALELARAFGGSLYVCSAFDVEYHHVVFNNIKDVLSAQASKVFKFEEQEALHNNIIDKGLLKLCQANVKRAEVMAREFPGVPVTTQILVGKHDFTTFRSTECQARSPEKTLDRLDVVALDRAGRRCRSGKAGRCAS